MGRFEFKIQFLNLKFFVLLQRKQHRKRSDNSVWRGWEEAGPVKQLRVCEEVVRDAQIVTTGSGYGNTEDRAEGDYKGPEKVTLFFIYPHEARRPTSALFEG